MTLLLGLPRQNKNRMTMKKNYFKPEVLSMNVVVEAMIATSVGSSNKPITPFSNESRGEWGNVWGDK